MTQSRTSAAPVPTEELRHAIQAEYAEVATDPHKGFHFHTGRYLTQLLGYRDEWLEGIPESAIEPFAGTGNPMSMGNPEPGERVVDMGCGAGLDSLIAARMTGPEGEVKGVDMTPAMLASARQAAEEAGLDNVSFTQGYAEHMPVDDDWADMVISNGVFNLTPDKPAVLQEIARILKPGGRLQFGDILVQKPVPEEAKENIDLWTG